MNFADAGSVQLTQESPDAMISRCCARSRPAANCPGSLCGHETRIDNVGFSNIFDTHPPSPPASRASWRSRRRSRSRPRFPALPRTDETHKKPAPTRVLQLQTTRRQVAAGSTSGQPRLRRRAEPGPWGPHEHRQVAQHSMPSKSNKRSYRHVELAQLLGAAES